MGFSKNTASAAGAASSAAVTFRREDQSTPKLGGADAVTHVAPLPAPPVNIRRFTLPDLEPMGIWLLGRLKERWPTLTDRNFAPWLRGCMESNEALFLRTDYAVLLFQISARPMSAVRDVQEVFALARDPNDPVHIRELGFLYQRMSFWAKGLGAETIHLENFTDMPREGLKALLGRVLLEQRAFVRLG